MLEIVINNVCINLNTKEGLFSPNALDEGTKAMLSCVDFSNDDKILDLGCGYGAVGIYAAKCIGESNVVMADIDENAIEIAKGNAILNNVSSIDIVHSNGFEKIENRDFTLILSNPPYHADFSVPKHFIEQGFNHLKIGGKLIMVTKRRDWYKNKLISVFGGVIIKEINGYYVFIAEKRKNSFSKTKPAKTKKKKSFI